MRAGRAARHTGTSAPSRSASACSASGAGDTPHSRPAAAAPPPHRPSRRRCRRRPAGSSPASAAPPAAPRPRPPARAPARSTRLSGSAASAAPNGPSSVSDSASAGAARSMSPTPREHRQAVEQVVAVGAPADDVQEQVDLGRRGLDERHARRHALADRIGGLWRPAARRRCPAPARSRAAWPRSFGTSSGSGFRFSARRHWNSASSLRPAAQ